MDYGKFLFELNKKRALAKKNQKQVQIKEIKMRPTTDEADYQVKMRKILEFIEEGDKVKVTIRFRGREIAHQELGMEVMRRIEKETVAVADVESRPRFEGKQMIMVLGPKKR